MPLERLPEDQQPISSEWTIADDIFIKRITVERAGTFIPQHAHTYEHVSFIAVGRVRVWRTDYSCSIAEEGSFVTIPANVKHTFETLVDRTTVLCIHNVSRAGAVEIAEEHQLA
jgi:quercetin dioxygenase-like cupin family protein